MGKLAKEVTAMMGYYGGWAGMGWFGFGAMTVVLLSIALLLVLVLRTMTR